MKRIIECVPNFSEGRDRSVIDRIVQAIASVKEVKVLDVDPGEATNRTVVTFVGEPDYVLEAAFRGAAKAAELIDMRTHHGAHPRSGATDVLPLIPVAGITLEECAELARGLAERLFPKGATWRYAAPASMKLSPKKWPIRPASPTFVILGTKPRSAPEPPTWAPAISL